MQCRLYLNLVNEGDSYPQHSDQMVFIYTWQHVFSILEYLGKFFPQYCIPTLLFQCSECLPNEKLMNYVHFT